jgi:hypothetical protein
MDWYFGVDMAIYHTTGANARVPVVPDGFLSLQVERLREGQRRRSYLSLNTLFDRITALFDRHSSRLQSI